LRLVAIDFLVYRNPRNDGIEAETQMEQTYRFVSNAWRIGLLFGVYAITLCVIPFLAELSFPRSGVLVFFLLTTYISVLAYLVCTHRSVKTSLHILVFGCLSLLSLGIAIPVAHDDIPYSLRGAEEQNTYFFFTSLWYWFCFLVISAFLYLVMRIVLASLVNGLLYLRGYLKFSIGNIFVTTIMISVCLILTMRGRFLEPWYSDQALVFALLSFVSAPIVWGLLSIDSMLMTWKLDAKSILGARLVYWGIVVTLSLVWFSSIYAIHNNRFLSFTSDYLSDGRFDSRDLDVLGVFWCTSVVSAVLATLAGIRTQRTIVQDVKQANELQPDETQASKERTREGQSEEID
jgi:hypothetical protein